MMWDGVFSPRLQKAARTGCDHGGTFIDIGDAEFGFVPVRVQFNHSCSGGSTPPSNNKVYTFEVELDSFTDAQSSETDDLRTLISSMSESEKLAWVSDNLVWEGAQGPANG